MKTRLAYFLGVTVLLLLAYWAAVRPAFALAYALLGLFVVAWAWTQLAGRGVELSRKVNPGTPRVGEAFEEEVEVSRRGWGMVPWVEVRDLGGMKDYAFGRVIALSGEGRVKWKTRGVYARRGWVNLGPTAVKVCEPFGLFEKEVKLGEQTRLLVYPRLITIPDLMTGSAGGAGSLQAAGAFSDYPPETGGVRDYASGDSFGRIHWPLSSRHERLMTKTFEPPSSTDLWIVLDLDKNAHFGEGEEASVESAVSLAGALAMQVLNRGRQVGLVATDERGTVLEPHQTLRQDRRIMDYLAVAQADGRMTLSQTRTWEYLRKQMPGAVAVITPRWDSEGARSLATVGGRQTKFSVFYLEGEGKEGQEEVRQGEGVDYYILRKGKEGEKLVRG